MKRSAAKTGEIIGSKLNVFYSQVIANVQQAEERPGYGPRSQLLFWAMGGQRVPPRPLLLEFRNPRKMNGGCVTPSSVLDLSELPFATCPVRIPTLFCEDSRQSIYGAYLRT